MRGSGNKPPKDSSGTQDKQKTQQHRPEAKHRINISTSTDTRENMPRTARQQYHQPKSNFREAQPAHRHGRPPPKPAYREPRPRAEELKPTPIGNMCTPTCPLFRCDKRALMIKLVNGKPQAFCTWVNDVCIGYKCRYVFCSQRYLLPDGKCAAVFKSDKKEEEDTFLKELESIKEDNRLRTLLGRKGLGKDMFY